VSHSDTEEQLLKLREFFAKTWKIIVPVIVLIFVIMFGWHFWQSHKAEQLLIASDKYESLLTQFNPTDPKSIDDLVNFANENDNIYGVFADLKVAQFYVVQSKDFARAESLLINARKKTNSEIVLAIINIRIAKLQYQLEKYQDSLDTLDRIKNAKWASAVNDIRGDIFVKLEKYSDACDAYNLALSSSLPEKLAEYIKIKLNQAEILKSKQVFEQEKVAKQKDLETKTN